MNRTPVYEKPEHQSWYRSTEAISNFQLILKQSTSTLIHEIILSLGSSLRVSKILGESQPGVTVKLG